jgi:hypothetical protein
LKERREWSWKWRLLLGIFILAIAALITYLIIYFLSKKEEKSMHEQSIDPTIPTFYEMSGRMTAPKLQPLIDTSPRPPSVLHEKMHLLRYL